MRPLCIFNCVKKFPVQYLFNVRKTILKKNYPQSLHLCMANLHRISQSLSYETNFRYDPGMATKSEEELKALGFYQGFPCAHGHTIRSLEKHWCYFCVQKILSNTCGFDINYLHSSYKWKYQKLWRLVEINSFKECWEIKSNSIYLPERVKMPSYRSEYSRDLCENINLHKAIYQCAWGDIGKYRVTKTCGNSRCANPLHLISSWNRTLPPKTINQMILDFDAQKLMVYANNKEDIDLSMQGMKMNIANPLEHKNIAE